jgi:hypothetical protein
MSKSGLATPQPEEHDSQSVSVAIVSAMHVDDKPVILVSDRLVEVKPLIDEKKDMPVCVDTGVQTDDSCADPVPMHMVPQVYDHRPYVSAPVRHFIGATVRMHTGKDGRVRQLCGPGLTHLLLGRAKQVRVQQHKVPARVEKKKVDVPKYKIIWRRKEVQPPRAIKSSRPRGRTWCGRYARLEYSDDT